MSKGDLVLSLVEDETIFVAYDTHFCTLYIIFLFLTSFASTVGWARILEMLYY